MSRTIIIVTGGPGTGKSYMAEQIAGACREIRLLSCDRIKEKNFDRFGFDNEEQKKELNQFSLEEFYLSLRRNMRSFRDILVEYPFYQVHRPRLEGLIREYNYRALTLYLFGDRRTIYERGVMRDKKCGRHPGHLTGSYHRGAGETSLPQGVSGPPVSRNPAMPYRQFCRMMEEKDYDIRLGETLAIDVTDLTAIPYGQILDKVEQMIHCPCLKSATDSLSVR